MSSYKVSFLQVCVLAFIGLVGIEAMALLMATSNIMQACSQNETSGIFLSGSPKGNFLWLG